MAGIVLLIASVSMADGDAGLSGFGASVREIGAGIRNYPNEALFGAGNSSDYYSETILRMTASNISIPRLSALFLEIHVVGGIVKTSMDGSPGLGGLSQSSSGRRYRLDWVGLETNTWDENGAAFYVDLDRANLKYRFSLGDLTVGRQAVTFGETYFWNPLDIFNPFDARSFDRDYKPGVDLLKLDVPFGDFSGMNVIVGAYNGGMGPSDFKRHVFIARCYGSLQGWDMAVQGGQVYGGSQFGYGFTGEAFSLEVRGEASWFKSKIDDRVIFDPGIRMLDDSFTGVAGLGRKVTDRVTVETEYLYNGAGIPENMDAGLARVGAGDALHIGRHLAGASVSWETMPLLATRFACIYSFSDGSRVFQPGLTWSLSNESELVAGAVINMGKRPGTDAMGFPRLRSEFGTSPDAYYMEVKIYF